MFIPPRSCVLVLVSVLIVVAASWVICAAEGLTETITYEIACVFVLVLGALAAFACATLFRVIATIAPRFVGELVLEAITAIAGDAGFESLMFAAISARDHRACLPINYVVARCCQVFVLGL